MLNEEKSLVAMCKFLLWLLISLIITFIGISGVCAQTIQGWAKDVNLYTDVNLLDCTSSSCSTSISLTPDYFYDTESLVKYNYFISNNHTIANYGDMILSYHRYLPGYLYSITSYVCFSSNVTLTNNDIDLYVGSYTDTINKVGNLTYHNVLVQTLDNHPYSPGDQYNKCYAIVNLFSPSVEGQNIGKVYKQTNSISSRTYLIGENFDAIGLYSGSLNSSINSAITNSGLATASSVQQIQTDIQEMQTSIIDAQTQNTQDLIDNQNQNTQEQIESQKVCKDYDSGSIDPNYNKGFLNSSGNYYTTNNTQGYGVSKYIDINNGDVTVLLSGIANTYTCFYNVDKTKISCINGSDLVENTQLTIPNGSYYIRTSIQKSSNRPSLRVCKNGNQALDDSINNLDDTLNDDDSSGATDEASDFFEDFTTDTFGLTSIITAPLNLIQSLLSSTCTDLQLPLPYLNNKYLILPCMTSIYTQHFGTFFTIYQTITYGIIAYWVCVRIFNQVKDFKNPEHDEIEVMDL